MSTAYPPRFVKYLFTSKKERNAARSSSMEPGFYGHFPPKFGFYYSGPGRDFLSQNFYLADVIKEGTSSKRNNLYAITLHKGPGSLQMTLYSSTQYAATPMAIARRKSPYSPSLALTFAGEDGTMSRTQEVRYTGLRHNSHVFTLNGDSYELTENARKKPLKRQILRLNTESSQSSMDSKTTGSKSKNKEDAEVIATWTEGSIPNKDYRLATFELESDNVAERLSSYETLVFITVILAVCQQGPAIEGAMSWHEEKKLEKGYYERQVYE